MSDPGDDDPQLRSLRAVWLSLPDEDPSDRGLGALMAAARVKAEAMARPPWWRRALALLRRPPALALASLTVVVAGAVLVGQHHESMDAMSSRAPTADPTRMSTVEREERAPSAAGVAAPAPGAAPVMTPVPEAEPPPPPAVTSDKLAAPHGHAAVTPKPAPPRRPAPVGGARKDADPGVATGGFAKAPVAAQKTDDVPEAADDRTEVLAGTKSAATPPLSKQRPGADRSGVSLASLLQQCHTAAARGDCQAVRSLAQRIASQDAGFYRDHVVKDSELGKCLAAE